MKEEYVGLLKKLSWRNKEDDQENAIREIMNDSNFQLNLLIQPLDKSCWENAAKILKMMGYEKTKALSYDLFKWLQDLNWPGASIIIELLTSYPNEAFLPYYEKAISEAIKTRDDPWLDYLSFFTYCGKISPSEFSNPYFYKIMKSHEIQWD